MKTRMAVSVAALVLSGVAASVALADDPPPITVPTPTVPVPQPDPGPVAKRRPKPQPSPRPTANRPAATPSRPVTPTYRPARATVAPQTRASRPATKKKAAVKKHRSKPKPSPATTKLPPRHEVKGAQKTLSNDTAPVATQGGSSSTQTNLLRTALLLAVASALGIIALLFMSASPRTASAVRRRKRLPAAGVARWRARPREVGVEVSRPRGLRGPIPLPPVLPPPEEVAPSVAEELPSDQLLADIAPPVAEPPASASADPEVTLEPEPETEPTRARPPFPAPGARVQPSAASQEQLLEEQPATFGETALPLQSAATDADKVPVARPVEEICEIGIWRGYVKSRFYAGLIGRGGEGIEFALAESLPVRLRGNGTPERTGATAEAHQALVNYLIESGWEVEPSRNGESWYALRFRRAAALAESDSA